LEKIKAAAADLMPSSYIIAVRVLQCFPFQLRLWL